MDQIMRSAFVGSIVVCLAGAAAALADGGAAVEQQYGQRVRAALASPDHADEIALAAEMTTAAKQAAADVAAALCEKAFAIATKTPDGDAAGVEALRLLMQRVPQKNIDALELIATLRQRRYQSTVKAAEKQSGGEAYILALVELAEAQAWAERFSESDARLRTAQRTAATLKSANGSAIELAIARCAARRELMTRLRGLEKRLAAGGPDAAATAGAIVKLYIVDLDDPASAIKYTGRGGSDEARRLTPLALKSPETLAAADALALGHWYRGWARQAHRTCIAPMLLRSHACYAHYLKLQKVQDVSRHEAQQGQREIEALMIQHNIAIPMGELAKAPTPTFDRAEMEKQLPQAKDDNKLFDVLRAPMEMRKDAENPSVWGDLLKLTRADRHAIVGAWKQAQEGVGGAFADSYARLALPVRFRGSYEIQVGFRVNAGTGKLALLLPIDDRHVAVTFNMADPRRSGLELIDTRPAEQTATVRKPVVIKAGQEYTVRFTVETRGEQVSIKGNLDGLDYLEWSGVVASVSAPPTWAIDRAGQPGLGAHPAGLAEPIDVMFNHVKFRVLNGEAETVVGHGGNGRS